MVKVKSGHRRRKNPPIKDVNIQWSSPANKDVSSLLELIKKRVTYIHSKNKQILKVKQKIVDTMVVMEWNRMTREIYSVGFKINELI